MQRPTTLVVVLHLLLAHAAALAWPSVKVYANNANNRPHIATTYHTPTITPRPHHPTKHTTRATLPRASAAAAPLPQGAGDDAAISLPLPATPTSAAAEELDADRLQFLKRFSIALLIIQNAVITILAKSSRTAVAGRAMYLGGVAVFASELLKLPVCLALIARDEGGVRAGARSLYERVVLPWRDTLAMGVPALCYCLQNLLFFVAVSNLSATSYQLWSQSKTLTTALFFVTYIGGVLRPIQWVALALLTAGVGLVQLADSNAAVAAAAGVSPLIGIVAVLLSSLLSGFANVYLEKMMKRSDSSLWVRNVQLAVFSIPQSLALIYLADAAVVRASGFWVGFTPLVWLVVALKALGGLIVAAVIKYADNILKTYATAVSIVLTCLLSIPLYGTVPSMGFLQGMALVIGSMFLYNKKPGGGAGTGVAQSAEPGVDRQGEGDVSAPGAGGG